MGVSRRERRLFCADIFGEGNISYVIDDCREQTRGRQS